MEDNKNSEREARVKKEYEKWTERYDIPLDKEFDVKALLQLQDEYNCFQYQPDKTKTRIDLMCMIERLERSLNLEFKKQTCKRQRILILTENFYPIQSILDLILEKNSVKFRRQTPNSSEIGMYNGTELLICKKDYLLQNENRGQMFDNYLNLTDDRKIESEVLVKLLRK